MGADYIDYLVADPVLVPEHAKPHYTEKIACLPSYQANDSARRISDKVWTRAEAGLPASGFVYCSFNASYKITPQTFDSWMRILKKTDGSVLWLIEGNADAARNLRQEASGRGIDTQLFSPLKRDTSDRIFRLGFVGRLCPEKNVRFLAELEAGLCQRGIHNYRFSIVGDGDERSWLERNLQRADFTGELHGELLARAYANMDLFVFPSETDTYGNVISEALASGTPAIVTSKGGPKYQVQDGVTGFIAGDAQEFLVKTTWLMANSEQHRRFRDACRLWACGRSWNNVLDDLLAAYQASFSTPFMNRVPALAAG